MEYINYVKITANDLILIELVVIDYDITLYILNGLSSKFNGTFATFRLRDNLIIFEELYKKSCGEL